MGPKMVLAARARPQLRGRTPTITIQKKKKEMTGQNDEFNAKRLSYGRKPRNNFKNLARFVHQNVSKAVYGYHGVSRFGGASGFTFLSQVQTALGTPVTCPIHLYDMTSVKNVVNNVTTLPQTGYYLQYTNETTSASGVWQPFIVNKQLDTEYSGNTATLVQNYPNANSTLRWGQAKMIFYAPTTIPSKINVSIIQFIDQDLSPANETLIASTLNTKATAWYQAYLKSKMFSPIETRQAGGIKGIKVLHSETFIMNPKESTEATSTHYKQLDIFKWFNRKCNYAWNQSLQTSDQSPVPAVNQGQNSTTVHPRARVWLLIQAQAGLATATIPTLHPSYDLVLRTQHEQSSS